MKNIILIGQKGVGKTSIGKLLQKKFVNRYNFLDTDRLVEKEFNLKNCNLKNKRFSTYDIHKKFGEDFFRQLESKIIFSLKREKNAIIATGGGSFLYKENRKILENIGSLFYLEISLDIYIKNINKYFLTNENFSKNKLIENFIFRKKIFESLKYTKKININNKTLNEIVDILWNQIALEKNLK